MFFKSLFDLANFKGLFVFNEVKEGASLELMDSNIIVYNMFVTMWMTLTIFKTFNNFILPMDLKKILMMLMIRDHVKSTCEAHILYRRLSKLLHEQWLLNFILYLKHNNETIHNAFMWNWSKCVLCDNSIFIAPCN
jgi:hypothetical protein